MEPLPAEAAEAAGEPSPRRENGRARNGLFAWLRRPKPPQEAPSEEPIQEEVTAAPSENFETAATAPPEPEPELLAAESPLRTPLRLYRPEEPAEAPAAEEPEPPVREITVPVVVPTGSKEVRLVVRLVLREESEEQPQEGTGLPARSMGMR